MPFQAGSDYFSSAKWRRFWNVQRNEKKKAAAFGRRMCRDIEKRAEGELRKFAKMCAARSFRPSIWPASRLMNRRNLDGILKLKDWGFLMKKTFVTVMPNHKTAWDNNIACGVYSDKIRIWLWRLVFRPANKGKSGNWVYFQRKWYRLRKMDSKRNGDI